MLTDFQIDALRELVNIGVGRAAQSLNMMLNEHITLSVPLLHMLPADTALDGSVPLPSGEVAMVTQSFSGEVMEGHASLLFPRDSAKAFVTALTGASHADDELDVMYEGTLTEIGNIVISGLFGSIANAFDAKRFSFSIPEYQSGDSIDLLSQSALFDDAMTGVLAEVKFSIQPLSISGHILMIFTSESLTAFVRRLEARLGLGGS